LRPGEAFALKWEGDPIENSVSWIDLDARMVHVRGTLLRVGVDKKKEKWVVHPPKTDNSNRDVPISDLTAELIEQWRERQAEERERAGSHECGHFQSTHYDAELVRNRPDDYRKRKRDWVLARNAKGEVPRLTP
jgi:integrase